MKSRILNIPLFLFIIFFTVAAQAQNITTICGNGTPGYSGDNGPATMAQISSPRDVVVDDSGNVYIADEGNNCVRRITSAGIITTVAGIAGSPGYSGDNGPATDAQLFGLFGIALDKLGNLYIADYSNSRIRKVDALGTITTVAGTGVMGYNGDGIAATGATLTTPCGVAVDKNGCIYICDSYNYRIRKVDIAGNIHTIGGTGTQGYSGDNGPATNAMLTVPYKICIDTIGNLYFTDGGSRVRKIDTFGIITTIAGGAATGYFGDGGPASAALMESCSGIRIDKFQNIYIADENNLVIRKINTAGIISTVAGNKMATALGDGGPATAARFFSPQGVAVDSAGCIYIADALEMRIRKVYQHTADIIEVSNYQSFIFPNPSIGQFTIVFATFQPDVKIAIINTIGQVVKEMQTSNTKEINIDLDVPDGIYYVRSGTQLATTTQALIVKH